MIVELELARIDSLSELRKVLSESPRSLLVGEHTESPRHFFLGAVESVEHLTIGLAMAGSSASKQALHQTDLGRVILGYDATVTLVDILSSKIILNERTEGVFYQFIPISDGLVVAIHELGADGISFDGEARWSVSSKDIVSNFSLIGNGVLEIEAMDVPGAMRVDVHSGKIL